MNYDAGTVYVYRYVVYLAHTDLHYFVRSVELRA